MVPRPPSLLAIFAALGGCAAGPDYAPPQPPSAPALRQGGFVRDDGARRDDAAPQALPARWWVELNDPVLTGLVEQGLRDAPTIAAAAARLRQARAALAGSRAGGLPSFGAAATYIGADLPDRALGNGAGTIDLFNVGFDAQWEADLWGGRRRGVEQARARAGAAAAHLADAQVTLSAEIARTYVLLRAHQASLALIDARHRSESAIADLARQRFVGGTVGTQVPEAAQAQLRWTVGEQAVVAAEIAVLRDSLAVLTGRAPGTLEDLPPAPIPLPPPRVAVGDPAAMLLRRPDVRAAERELAAAQAQIGVEAARRFPQVSLLGVIGIGGSDPGDLFDGSQLLGAVLPRLRWNILDFGRIGAAVKGAEAGRDAARAEYDAATLAALRDAEASLARFGAARTAYSEAAGATANAERAAAVQDQRAAAGTIALGTALEARRQTIAARLAEADRRAAVTLAFVALVKALGLGWEAGAPTGEAGQ